MFGMRKWLTVVAVMAGAAMFLCGVQVLWAQAQPGRVKPAYQYVGVDQTIARIDPETGRIEILSKSGEPRASLLMQGRKPWEWREVRVKEGRATREGLGRAPDQPPMPENDEP